MVPDHARVGDLICVLYGCDVPVVLRKIECHYKFIGESYVHGIMHGEAIEASRRVKCRNSSSIFIS
ncbi:hypothetical protein F5883DRAFT_439740 [Diaporthe sp. PMI_573]|nr:hypothetical protein F5883DRAFT_439740 [Diaporthaceae sp. PMI_573]